MLVKNRSSRSQNSHKIQQHNFPNQAKSGRRKKLHGSSQSRHKQSNFQQSKIGTASQNRSQSTPVWLTMLLLTKNASSLVCYVTVGLALAMYSMTVYAPQLWTQKYNQLRDLQKKERQFTFSEEVIKHQLANDASQPDSGLVNPDPTKPPIFLPETNVKQITQPSANQSSPKQIHPIYPVAY